MAESRELPLQPIYETLVQLFQLIEIGLERKFQMPTLILIYSGIDAVAWLGADPSTRAVRDRFVGWTDRYLIPAGGVPCRAIDLYAARCGMLHTLTADSDLVEKGQAVRLAYAWGNAVAADLQAVIDKAHPGECVAVHISDIATGFRLGTAQMFDDAEKDPVLKGRMEARIGKFFTRLPSRIDDWPRRPPRAAG